MSELIEVTPEVARFRQSELLRDALAVLLEDPVMVQALAAVQSVAIPRSVPKQVPGVHHDTIIAHNFWHTLGVTKALTTLRFMTTDGGTLGDKLVPEDEAFEHAIPKDFQEMPEELKKQH